MSYFVLEMKLIHTFRGSIPISFQIYEANDSGRAPFDWKVGTGYLLFLFPSVAAPANVPDTWSLDGCGNSGPLKDSASVLKTIHWLQLKHVSGGLITGMVEGDSISAPISTATVVAVGNGKSFKTTTNDKGEFKLHVPAGEYRVRARNTTIRFKPYFLSYENPLKVLVEDGGCAQIQFTKFGD